MVMMGYEKGSKAYRLYNPSTGQVCVSCDVVFEETKGWNWEGVEEQVGDMGGEWFSVHYEPEPSNSTDEPSTSVQEAEVSSPDAVLENLEAPYNTPIVDDIPIPETPEGAVKTRSLDDLYEDTLARWSPADFDHVQNLELCMLGAEEPTHHDEALKHDAWRKAMEDELTSILENETWELVAPPEGVKPIGLKWVFKLKKDAEGNVIRHKARLVAKGYIQRQGIDFDEVFAPIARIETVRLLIALAAQSGWSVHHLDVKSAFLNGDLEEVVYVTQPPGFVESGKECKVLRLRKALYGLRQAPRAWNIKLDHSLLSLGFIRSPVEHSVYTQSEGGARLLVGVYVDDLIITGSDKKEIAKFKTQMNDLFSMNDRSHYLL